jgi:hypothetical protein
MTMQWTEWAFMFIAMIEAVTIVCLTCLWRAAERRYDKAVEQWRADNEGGGCEYSALMSCGHYIFRIHLSSIWENKFTCGGCDNNLPKDEFAAPLEKTQ